jgi:hypothetical protein
LFPLSTFHITFIQFEHCLKLDGINKWGTHEHELKLDGINKWGTHEHELKLDGINKWGTHEHEFITNVQIGKILR